MGNIGVGAALHYLGGGSQESPDKYYGKKIKKAELLPTWGEEGGLRIDFYDPKKNPSIVLHDSGRSCCESRYMTCDDDLKTLKGGLLTKIEIKNFEEEDECGEPHEICFLEIATDKTFVTIAFHNRHNGYYGGFGLNIAEL